MYRVTLNIHGEAPNVFDDIVAIYTHNDTQEFTMLSVRPGSTEWPVCSLLKVEKKVKYLTLEECEQLNIDYLDYAATRNVYRHGYSDTIDLSMDEYIDITHLVKGDAEV